MPIFYDGFNFLFQMIEAKWVFDKQQYDDPQPRVDFCPLE